MSATPFTATYKNFRKVVLCKEYANIYDDIALKFSNCLISPRHIKLQHEEVNDFIDLEVQFSWISVNPIESMY